MSSKKKKKKEQIKGLSECAARLKEIRSTLGFSQAEFAKRMRVSKPTYVRYEAGQIWPKMNMVSILFHEYDVNINWLLVGEGEPFGVEVDGEFTSLPTEYVEMIKLMQHPQIEQFMRAELEKLKQIFKPQIEAYFAKEEEKKHA